MFWSGWPWYAQIIGIIVAVLVAVFLFREIIVPLLKMIT